MVMLARSAEDLYWVGRYLERTESMARTIDVVYHRSLETPEGERGRVWADALTMIGFPAEPNISVEIIEQGRPLPGPRRRRIGARERRPAPGECQGQS